MSSAPLPADENIASALKAIRAAISQYAGCSEAERTALARDMDQLTDMADKLDRGRVEVVVFGEISTGKSALINALVGDAVTEVNIQGGWTKDVWHLDWEGAAHHVPGLADSEIVLVDTPGLNEVEGAQRTAMAQEAAARADLVLFVTDSDLNETEFEALRQLAAGQKPIIVIVNKSDLYSPDQIDRIAEKLKTRLRGLVAVENVVFTAAEPREVEYILEDAAGQQRREWRTPPADVAQLRERILKVLEAEGKALVALNAAMYAADKSDRMAALRVQLRESKAATTIWSFAATKAVAVAINPIVAADIIGGTAVDASMVATLARVYGIQITTTNAQQLVTSILKAAGWVMLSEAAVHVAASLFKGLTVGLGTVVTALPQGAAAGYGSYIVGQAARYYFQHGASWGDASPKAVVLQIIQTSDKQSILEQLKDEIRKKISVNPYAGESE